MARPRRVPRPRALEERLLVGRGADVRAAEPRHHAPPRGALDEPELEQVGLVDVLDRVRLLTERDGERREPDRPSLELVHDRGEQLAVDPLEALRVDLEQIEGLGGDLGSDRTLVAHLGHVADAAQDAVRDPRRAARPAGDLRRGLVGDLDPEDVGRAEDDPPQLLGLVIAQAEGHSEAVAQRCGQQSGAGRRADEREARQVEAQRPGGRALADDDVDPEVLERRVEDLLDCRVQPVDLVHEQDVALAERREDGSQVALSLERRPGDRADPGAELLADDVREARLAEPRGADEEDVVERFRPRTCRLESDGELLFDPLLADEHVEPPRTQRALDLLVLGDDGGREELGSAQAALSACRTRSSGGSSASVAASACSASTTDQPSSTSASRATRCGLAALGSIAPIFSFSSSTTRSAVFLPIPGIAWKRAMSSRAIARRSSAGGEPETIASATFGPTPETARSASNSSRSPGSAKP